MTELQSSDTDESQDTNESHSYYESFSAAIANDFQLPQALATTWEMLKSDLPGVVKLKLLLDFDKVFGLRLDKVSKKKIPEEIAMLAEKRKLARQKNDFKKSDEIRNKIYSLGYSIEDIENNNYKIKKQF